MQHSLWYQPKTTVYRLLCDGPACLWGNHTTGLAPYCLRHHGPKGAHLRTLQILDIESKKNNASEALSRLRRFWVPKKGSNNFWSITYERFGTELRCPKCCLATPNVAQLPQLLASCSKCCQAALSLPASLVSNTQARWQPSLQSSLQQSSPIQYF